MKSPLQNPFPVDAEEDVTFYASIHLIEPLLHLIQDMYPNIAFNVRNQASEEFEIIEKNVRGMARTDLVIEAGVKTSYQRVPDLILEYKRSGSLRIEEWTDGLEEGEYGRLLGNGVVIGRQLRKYLLSVSFPMVLTFDGSALAGVRANRSRTAWASSKEMKVDVFYEDKAERFMSTLLAVLILGLEHQSLIVPTPQA